MNKSQKQPRKKVWISIGAVCIVLLAAYFSLLIGLTMKHMESAANPYVAPVEGGVWNLTAQELTIPAEELDEYVFYTNSTRIQVTAQITAGKGRIGLTRVEVPDTWLLENVVSPEHNTLTFTSLSAADRYILCCEGLDGILVTVGDGREVNFWTSFLEVQHSFWDGILRN